MRERKELKLALTGKGGAGKDTVAFILKKDYGFDALAFSDELYVVCRRLFGMGLKDRALLQDVGSALRSVDPEVFVKNTLARAEDLPRVLITDVRHPNEYKALKDNGYIIIKVDAPLDKRIERIEKRDRIKLEGEEYDRLVNSPIEKYMDDFEVDYILDNSKDGVDYLGKAIYEMIFKLIEED